MNQKLQADCDGELTMRRNNGEEDRVRELQLSIAASSSSVFPGFRFSPTDVELISYYLKKKLQGNDSCVDIISEVDFCCHEPWDLPGFSVIPSDTEWFFFSTRGKKYPNGSQSKRATQSGYWKATGKERNVKSGGITIGTKRTLVFHTGRAPKGERTEWIMHEYCMSDTSQETLVVCRLRRNGEFRSNESSSDRRISSVADTDHHSATNDGPVDDTQIHGFDDGNGAKSCSMESKSHYRISCSDEQNDSESATDQHHLQNGSSTPYKERCNEDDCFADIINDDIVKLDESSSHSLVTHVFTGTKHTKLSPHDSVSAADGRTEHEKPSSYCDHNNHVSDRGCVISVLTGNAKSLAWFSPAYLVLVFLLLVVLFVAWQQVATPDNRRPLTWKFPEGN